mgnify:CR=1 FL=1
MHYNLISIILIFNIIFSKPEIGEYLWPSDASETITTVFGDKRSRRFHAGIDVRTYGEIGGKLFAVESGYISRISISPHGYGKSLYLKLNDGNTAVYAHLDSYTDKLNNFIYKYKKDNQTNFLDIYFNNNDFKFNKGDLIGYSGDTGSLSGGHLHFEIRNKDGEPINPLKHHYRIHDTKKPIPYSLAFIPIDSSAYINGKQQYMIYNLTKYDESRYVMNDTISAIGNFGLAVNVIDEINDQPFSYGVYNIEAFIDNREIYSISFEKYNMINDLLIYNEIDYNLLTKKNKKFHRLYINNNKELDFIKDTSVSSLNLDEDFHDLLINITDINNNKTSIHGIVKGDVTLNHNLELVQDTNNLFLVSNRLNLDKYKLFLTTRYEKGIKASLNYNQIDSVKYSIIKSPPPFNVIEYFVVKDGIPSISKYLSLDELAVEKINGSFDIISLDKGILIQFKEDYFSGYEYELKLLKKDNQEISIDAYRISKTKISSKILDFSYLKNIKKIILSYKTKPEIEFSEKINGEYISHNSNSTLVHGNFAAVPQNDSFYNDIFISCKDTSISITDYKIIDGPIKLKPDNIPFKNHLNLYYENFTKDTTAFGIYKFDGEKWRFQDKSKEYKIKTEIFSGGTFAILNENEKPIIKNLIPADNGTYNKNDLNEISFNCYDDLSGINPNNIKILLDNELYYYDYIKYRKLTKAPISKKLKTGKHSIKIYVNDNLNNTKFISYDFFIK